MQISRKRINKNIEQEIYNLFYQLVADIKSPKEAEIIINDLFGKDEITAFSKRLAIAHYLQKQRSYQNIKDNLKVSSATISTIDKQRNTKGYLLALKKIEAEKWASEWSSKIENLLKKK